MWNSNALTKFDQIIITARFVTSNLMKSVSDHNADSP